MGGTKGIGNIIIKFCHGVQNSSSRGGETSMLQRVYFAVRRSVHGIVKEMESASREEYN